MRLWAFLSLFCAFATMPASAGNLDAKFLIKREGKVIGYHAVDVREADGAIIVDTEIEMRVKLGPIPLFKYDHASQEVWRAGEVVSIESKTNYNGDKTYLSAYRENDLLMIDGSEYQGPAPANAVPSSYWDKSLLTADALINTQNGEIVKVVIEPLGVTPAPHNREAEQFRVTGTVGMDIWYNGAQWVGSQFTIDGEELTYELVAGDRQYAALEEYLD